MNNKRVHYLFAGLSFFVALIVYLLTMQPSIPFWDCGEFAAAAWGLQVPHPPGSPLWTLIGRVGMMMPTFEDPVARYTLLSVLSSAVVILLVYLTVVRLVRLWRGEPKSMADILTHYGGAFVGALSFTFTDSFWFNALESEVYAFGSLFIAIIPWLMLVWYDHADEEHSEKYILLVSYIIGLSMGVHQLALLTIFPVFMLIYYRRRQQVTTSSWLGMAAASVVAFIIAYKVVLSKLVEWMASPGSQILSIAIIGGCIAGIWYSQKNKKPILNLSLWAAMLLFLGYSTYALIMVRAEQNPPMNQWQASTFENITKFINREQYGTRAMWPRQHGDESGRSGPTFTNYSGNWDFLWSYQIQHMYNRYLAWNFVGRDSQRQDTGADWSKTWGIPLLIGMFGMYWHFKRDPKRALAFLAAFILLGWMTALYQNQQDPQPRERDYFYTGAFYVFALWVGIGATGMIELLRGRKKRDEGDDFANASEGSSSGLGMVAGAFALLILAVPLNQALGLAGMATGKSFDESSKWAMYSRANNYIPFEYAYNTLQSCEKDAVLFTAGDNDTFPLWCIQDVYGIRRDVRIVNLSLGNMGWYIKQLKNDVWGEGKKVELPGFTDAMLADPDFEGKTYRLGKAEPASVNITAETMKGFTEGQVDMATVLNWTYRGQIQRDETQYIFTVSDQLIKSILEGNINKRPIYFASVVPEQYMIGLHNNIVSEGLAKRVTPLSQQNNPGRIDDPINVKACEQMLMHFVSTPSKTPQRGLYLRTFTDPDARWNNDDRTNDPNFISYQFAYLRLASFYHANEVRDLAKAALDTMQTRIPPSRVKYLGIAAQSIARLYKSLGDDKGFRTFIAIASKDYDVRIEEARKNRQLDNEAISAYLFSAEAKIATGDPEGAITLMNEIMPSLGERERLPFDIRMMQAQAAIAEKKGDKRKALDIINELLTKYGQAIASHPDFSHDFQMLVTKRMDFMAEFGVQDTLPQ